jgi:hypothetical protein
MEKLIQSVVVTTGMTKTHVSTWNESHFYLVFKAKDADIFVTIKGYDTPSFSFSLLWFPETIGRCGWNHWHRFDYNHCRYGV